MERTVWDGDQVLFEIRAPIDPDPLGISNPESETGGGGDERFYGRVGYVHAGGIDQPLEIARMDVGSPFVVVPHANWRGMYDVVTFTGARYAQCGPQVGYDLGSQPECFPFELQSVSSYGELKPKSPDGTDPGQRSWLGSLITGSRDGSGLLYRRNRYLDPKTGRFTQEDPIGLAGGLNAYGFAKGDPVSYSDPYGLCAQGDTLPAGALNYCPVQPPAPSQGTAKDLSWSIFADVVPVGRIGRAVGWVGQLARRVFRRGAVEAAEQTGRLLLREGQHVLAVVHQGKILARTPDETLSHAAFVQRSIGTLPEGARVVTVGKFRGEITALNSRTFHGNQLPAPQEVLDVVRNNFR